MADHLTVLGLAQGLAMLAALWWCWCSYAWLGNTVHADRGVARFAIFAAMAMMFLVSLTIPEAFTDFAGGLYAPIMFVACYFATCGLALAAGMWWMYFDVVARVSEHKLSSATGVERAKIASDSYTFLHLPLIAGIVLVALGLKRVCSTLPTPSTTARPSPCTECPSDSALYASATSARGTSSGSCSPP
jgi:low temperature requirement protein LtrA